MTASSNWPAAVAQLQGLLLPQERLREQQLGLLTGPNSEIKHSDLEYPARCKHAICSVLSASQVLQPSAKTVSHGLSSFQTPYISKMVMGSEPLTHQQDPMESSSSKDSETEHFLPFLPTRPL